MEQIDAIARAQFGVCKRKCDDVSKSETRLTGNHHLRQKELQREYGIDGNVVGQIKPVPSSTRGPGIGRTEYYIESAEQG
jgi:hypothetical protein